MNTLARTLTARGVVARSLLGAGAALAVVGTGLGTLGSATADPPGNNGTVKVVNEGDVDLIPNNEPHENCVFKLQWYDFDKGEDIISTVTFTLQAPTKTPEHSMTVNGPGQVPVGGDPAAGTGNDLDGEAVYTLAFTGPPQPNQGYHVKLTVNTPGSKGADKKSKVFWVLPCLPPPPTPTETTTPTETPSRSATVLGTQATASPSDAASGLPTLVAAGRGGPVGTGSSGWSTLSLLLSSAGLLMFGIGTAVAFASRYRGRHQV